MAHHTADVQGGQTAKARRRGMGFNRDQSVKRSARSIASSVEDFVSSVSPISGPRQGEIRKVRNWVNTLNGLLDALSGASDQLQSIMNGRYTDRVKSKAGNLQGQVNSAASNVRSERNRAQNWLNENADTPQVGDDPRVQPVRALR